MLLSSSSKSDLSQDHYLRIEDASTMKQGSLPLSSSPSGSRHGSYADRHTSSRIRNAVFRLLATACIAITVLYLARLGAALTALRYTVQLQGVELKGMAAHVHSAISEGTEDVRSQVTQHRDKLVSLETAWKMMEDETSSRQKQAEQQISKIEKKLAEIWEMKEEFNTKMQKVDGDTKPLLVKVKDMPLKLDQNDETIKKLKDEIGSLKIMVDAITKTLEAAKGGKDAEAKEAVKHLAQKADALKKDAAQREEDIHEKAMEGKSDDEVLEAIEGVAGSKADADKQLEEEERRKADEGSRLLDEEHGKRKQEPKPKEEPKGKEGSADPKKEEEAKKKDEEAKKKEEEAKKQQEEAKKKDEEAKKKEEEAKKQQAAAPQPKPEEGKKDGAPREEESSIESMLELEESQGDKA